ncbi:GNAT family N-acetyltransferase [Thermanaerothrix sp.]|jgi:ribosomal protein S18 acetylase RimI-like enzyme|uniref:GNAT family N-acetyltransferase n=1 Tax=Thermanaerothrix sp. TaxID=2972675 RepID=UPI002ADE5E62|nr:GNAT family N-acetyltransferase [Thermanaerothrix sp.]
MENEVWQSPFRIRPATPKDAQGIAWVHVDTWRAAYAGLIPANVLAQLSVEHDAQQIRAWIAQPRAGSFWWVAEKMGSIVGFASGGPERSGDEIYRGEIYALYVLPAFQRQGIGRQLVVASVQSLLQSGLTSMLIWVLAENHPARAFYARLGGQPVREQMITIGGTSLREIGYGWGDIKPLFNHEGQHTL